MKTSLKIIGIIFALIIVALIAIPYLFSDKIEEPIFGWGVSRSVSLDDDRPAVFSAQDVFHDLRGYSWDRKVYDGRWSS